MVNQQKLVQRVVEYLDSQNWRYSFKGEKNNVIRFGMNLNCKLKNCDVLVLVSDHDIQTYAVSPINASKDVYGNVVEFITRANYGIKLGKFEFDYSDGEVRFQTCLSCQEDVPSLADVERVVDVSFMTLQHYGDGLAKNLMGFGNPEMDIKAIED